MLENILDPWPIRLALLCIGLAGLTYPQWWPMLSKGNSALFDMPVSDAIQHIFETVTIPPNEKDVFVKQALLEQLFSYMRDGRIAVWCRDFAPPRKISVRKCRKLSPQIKRVPPRPNEPEGFRFSLFEIPPPEQEEEPFVEYTNLWIRSEDLYKLWPTAGII